MAIDRRFIDVDFAADERFTFGDLGCAMFSGARPAYDDVVPIIPRGKWREEIEKMDAAGGGADQLVTRIYDQKNEGSCVANACSQACEIVQALQFGKDNVVHLSAMSLYKRIGSSPNSGAMVSDGLEEMATKGVLPLDNPENRARFGDKVMPNTGWREKYPDGWEDVAKQFRAHEWFIVRDMDSLITALLNQHPVVVGRSGHSICYCRPMYDGNDLVVKYANSWGDWGQDGYGFDSERMIKSSSSWAFALRSIVVP